MATKRNIEANRELRDAQNRARRKLHRLRSQGVNIKRIDEAGVSSIGDRNVIDFKNVDTSNTREVNARIRELNAFIDRDTQYRAGIEGTPIPLDLLRQYKRLERAYNEAHARYWRSEGGKPIITTDGETTETLRDRSAVAKYNYNRFPFDLYENAPIDVIASQVKSVKELLFKIEKKELEVSPQYMKKRTQAFRANALRFAEATGRDDVARFIKSMSLNQLMALQNRTDFSNNLFSYYDADKMRDDEVEIGFELEQDKTNDHLIGLIRTIKKNF